MKIGVVSMWLISLPLSYLCGFVVYKSPIGLRMGFISGFIVAVVMLLIRLRKKMMVLARSLSSVDALTTDAIHSSQADRVLA
jgi:Na+-driven multidrug efflux pump